MSGKRKIADENDDTSVVLQDLQSLTIVKAPFSIDDAYFERFGTSRVHFLEKKIARKGPYKNPRVLSRLYFRHRVLSDVWQDLFAIGNTPIAFSKNDDKTFYVCYRVCEPNGTTLAAFLENLSAVQAENCTALLQKCFLHLIYRFVLGIDETRNAIGENRANASLEHIVVTCSNKTGAGLSYWDRGAFELVENSVATAFEWKKSSISTAFDVAVKGVSLRRRFIEKLVVIDKPEKWYTIDCIMQEHSVYSTKKEREIYLAMMKTRLHAVLKMLKN